MAELLPCCDAAAVGGVCLNVGCIPSKALLHVAAIKEVAERLVDRCTSRHDERRGRRCEALRPDPAIGRQAVFRGGAATGYGRRHTRQQRLHRSDAQMRTGAASIFAVGDVTGPAACMTGYGWSYLMLLRGRT